MEREHSVAKLYELVRSLSFFHPPACAAVYTYHKFDLCAAVNYNDDDDDSRGTSGKLLINWGRWETQLFISLSQDENEIDEFMA